MGYNYIPGKSSTFVRCMCGVAGVVPIAKSPLAMGYLQKKLIFSGACVELLELSHTVCVKDYPPPLPPVRQSLLLLGRAVHDVPQLGQDLDLPLAALLVVELGQGALLVGAVDLVLLPQTDSLHTAVPGEHTAVVVNTPPSPQFVHTLISVVVVNTPPSPQFVHTLITVSLVVVNTLPSPVCTHTDHSQFSRCQDTAQSTVYTYTDHSWVNAFTAPYC